MRIWMFLMMWPMLLKGFEPQPVTPFPVVGFQQIAFFDADHQMQRDILVWYPVSPLVKGAPSKNPWDIFKIALNALPSQMNMPVIILSHGYTGNPHQLSWLIRHLVYQGFLVLGIQHLDLIEGKVHVNHWQRPLDVKKMLDQFEKNRLAHAVDLNRVGIAGFSLGGTTSIWIAGGRTLKLDSLIPGADYAAPEDYVLVDEALPSLDKSQMRKDWRDPRVKAAFAMAPAWSWLFDEKSLEEVTIPVYLIAASADPVLVTRNNAGFFARHIPQSTYQEISGKGGHYIFISALTDKQRGQADPSDQLTFLFQDDVSIDRQWIQWQVGQEAGAFFKEALEAVLKP